MIDIPAQVRAYLVAQSPLTTHTSTRIWEERNVPPEQVSYTPAVGGAIVFRVRGGQEPAYPGVLLYPSVQFKCYGPDEHTANTVYRALHDVLHDQKSGYFLQCLAESIGQILEEPETGWLFNLSFFEFTMLNS